MIGEIELKLKKLNCIHENIDLDEYIQFRKKVKKQMLNPEWFGDFSKETLLHLLHHHSKIWIYYLNDEPICSMMFIPADQKSLSKFELDLNFKEVAEYGPMMVHPQYVGNQLQYQMLECLDKYCSHIGYKYAVSTIHPDNMYSINNLVKDVFEYKHSKNFKRGPLNVYIKKI